MRLRRRPQGLARTPSNSCARVLLPFPSIRGCLEPARRVIRFGPPPGLIISDLMDRSIELYVRPLPDGRVITVIPLTFSRARVTIGPDAPWYQDQW